MDQSDFGKSR